MSENRRSDRASRERERPARGHVRGNVTRGSLFGFALFWPLLAFACLVDAIRGQAAAPRLAVVVVVDQMRADYLDRFEPLFEGGLARLLAGSARFTDAHQDHAVTVTAVGHATLATGVFPARHGIVGNDFMDRAAGTSVYSAWDPDAPLLGDADAPGRSPRRLEREGLADWLRAARPESRVFSASIKDRSAIMLGGRAPDGAFWYHAPARGFVTSSYYASEIPDWVEAFDAPSRIASYFETGWDRALPPEAYRDLSREDAFPVEGDGGRSSFPYDFSRIFPEGTPEHPGEAFYDDFPHTPYADAVLLELARAAIEELDLGGDEIPDLLLIAPSAGDYIGHRWGPYSHEIQDYYVRLDRYLGELFAHLDERLGPDGWSAVLSADHGVAPAPEESVRRGEAARRIDSDEYVALLRGAIAEAVDEVDPWPRPQIRWLDGAHFLPSEAGLPPEEELRALRAAVARRLEAADFVREAFTREEVTGADPWGSDAVHAFRRSFDPRRSPDVMVLLEPYHLVGSTTASHGSAWSYDSRVPLLFMGSGAAPGSRGERVRTVDVAPTLAARLGIPAPADLDGRVLELGSP